MISKAKFENWLIKRGAILESPTNEWELIRFRTAWGLSVIYSKKNGDMTFTGESRKAYKCFTDNKPWKTVDRKRQQLRSKKAALATRDGKKCFFHGEPLEFDKLTIEHWVPFSQGGTDHQSNLVLACESCNAAVGNIPVAKKVLFRDKMMAKNDVAYFVKLYLGTDLLPPQLKILEKARKNTVRPSHEIQKLPVNRDLKTGLRVDLEPF